MPKMPGSTSAVADLLGLDPSTVRLMARRGDLPGARKIRGVWRFDLAMLRRWLKAQEAGLISIPHAILPDPYDLRSVGKKSDDPLERAMAEWRRRMKECRKGKAHWQGSRRLR